MTKPVFRVEEGSFLGIGTSQFERDPNRTIFGNIDRFYIDGELEIWAGYDLCQFISGDIIDAEQQDALLISNDGEDSHEAQIVMVTLKRYGEIFKGAYLVVPGEEEKQRAFNSLMKQYEQKV